MISPGTKAEIDLADFISEPLLLDFVHLQPECIEGERPRELSDLLIEDGNLAIPVQLKFQDRKKAAPNRDEQRWAKNKLKVALSQLEGAIKNLEKYEINAKHPFRGKVSFPSNYFRCNHGLVIIDYNSKPFELEPHFSRRTKYGVPIHYFSYNNFITLCQKLMSLPDLVEYLDERSKIPAWATPKIGDEKNAYAYYLTHKSKFNSSIIISDFENQWEELVTKNKVKYAEKEYEDENVLIYNHILSILSTKNPIAVSNSDTSIQNILDLRSDNRISMTRILNKVRRINRREISKKLMEKIIKSETSELGFNYFAYKTQDPDTIFLFLASRHPREERIEQIRIIADCINNIHNPKRIIGIATESKTAPAGRSYDFIYIEDLQPTNDQKIIEICKELVGEFNFNLQYDFPSDKKNRFSI